MTSHVMVEQRINASVTKTTISSVDGLSSFGPLGTKYNDIWIMT